MLQTEVNIQVGNKVPNEYMKIVIEQCNGQENKYGAINNLEDLHKNMEENCIPESLIYMPINDYDEFLRERRKLMAKKIKEYYNALDKAHTTGNYTDFVKLVNELEIEMLNKYLELL